MRRSNKTVKFSNVLLYSTILDLKTKDLRVNNHYTLYCNVPSIQKNIVVKYTLKYNYR